MFCNLNVIMFSRGELQGIRRKTHLQNERFDYKLCVALWSCMMFNIHIYNFTFSGNNLHDGREIFQPNVASVQFIIHDFCLICKISNVSICKRSLSVLYAFQIIIFDNDFYAHVFFTRDKQVEKFLQFCLRNYFCLGIVHVHLLVCF